jgi:hypothetical protein
MGVEEFDGAGLATRVKLAPAEGLPNLFHGRRPGSKQGPVMVVVVEEAVTFASLSLC